MGLIDPSAHSIHASAGWPSRITCADCGEEINVRNVTPEPGSGFLIARTPDSSA